jgi:hypothetical protein
VDNYLHHELHAHSPIFIVKEFGLPRTMTDDAVDDDHKHLHAVRAGTIRDKTDAGAPQQPLVDDDCKYPHAARAGIFLDKNDAGTSVAHNKTGAPQQHLRERAGDTDTKKPRGRRRHHASRRSLHSRISGNN